MYHSVGGYFDYIQSGCDIIGLNGISTLIKNAVAIDNERQNSTTLSFL